MKSSSSRTLDNNLEMGNLRSGGRSPSRDSSNTYSKDPDDSWRSKVMIVSCIAALTLVVMVANQSFDSLTQPQKRSNAVSYGQSGTGVALDYLFDFSTADGAYENVSVYDDPTYSEVVVSMNEKAAFWQTQVNFAEVADSTGRDDQWDANGYISPWLTDDTGYERRLIYQQYDYKDAPNIVFFVVDDWGWNDAGYQSTYMSWTTPNIDKLAASGIKLTNYHTNELCTPTRAALLTGRYAFRFGMQGADLDKVELPTAEATVAEEMKSAGYRTYMIGKWHMGWSTYAKTPTYRGFDYFYGYWGGFVDYWTKMYGTDLDLHENAALVTNATELDSSMHSAYLYQSHAEAVIEDHATKYPDQPMFLYYASQLIHTEWEVPQSYKDLCSVQGSDTADQISYCAMNIMLDEMVGRLSCALDRSGLADNTVFVFASDNGGNGLMDGNNHPFRGAKGSLFRGGVNVPAFVMGPSSFVPSSRKGQTYDGQMHVTDWLPTLMGLATGGEWSGSLIGSPLDGVDMWSAITDNSDTPRREIVHYVDVEGNVSIQIDMNKLLLTKPGEADAFFIAQYPRTGKTSVVTCPTV